MDDINFSLPAMGSVFIEPGGEVPTSLADVHFATLTRNSVDTRPALGVLPVLV